MPQTTSSTTATRRHAARSAVRYSHISCQAYMVQNPAIALGRIVPHDQRLVPYVTRPGVTYNVGRNDAKRGRRLIKGVRK